MNIIEVNQNGENKTESSKPRECENITNETQEELLNNDQLLIVKPQINEASTNELSVDPNTNKKKNKRKRKRKRVRSKNKKRSNTNTNTNCNSPSTSTSTSLSISKSPKLRVRDNINLTDFAYNFDINYFSVSQSCPIGYYCNYDDNNHNNNTPMTPSITSNVDSVPLTPELETAFTDFFVGNDGKNSMFSPFDDKYSNHKFKTEKQLLLSDWITNLELEQSWPGINTIKKIIIEFADDSNTKNDDEITKITNKTDMIPEILNFEDIDRELGLNQDENNINLYQIKPEEINLSPAEFEDDEAIYHKAYQCSDSRLLPINDIPACPVQSPVDQQIVTGGYGISPEYSATPCMFSPESTLTTMTTTTTTTTPMNDGLYLSTTPHPYHQYINPNPNPNPTPTPTPITRGGYPLTIDVHSCCTPCMFSPETTMTATATTATPCMDYNGYYNNNINNINGINDINNVNNNINNINNMNMNINGDNNTTMFNFPAPRTPPPPPEIECIPDFSQWTTHQIIAKNFSLKQLIKYELIVRLSKDQHGSRMVQNKLKHASKTEAISMVSLLIHHFMSLNINLAILSEDIFGNYVVQLLFQRGNMIHHKILLKYFIYDYILRLSQSKNGCRVIQTIFKSITNLGLLVKLVDAFKKQLAISSTDNNNNNNNKKRGYSIRDALQCVNGNRVLQSMIEAKLPYECLSFLAREFESDLIWYCQETNACRVMQAYLEVYGDKINFRKLFLDENYLKLATNVHGNYTIQCIIRSDKWYSNSPNLIEFRNKMIYDMFAEKNIEYFSTNKHGSNVIETCIRSSNMKHIEYLVNVLCRKQGMLLTHLMSDKFGNYIPKTLLENIPRNSRKNYKLLQLFINTIQRYIVDLYNYDCHYHQQFKHCCEFIISAQQVQQELDYNFNNNHK